MRYDSRFKKRNPLPRLDASEIGRPHYRHRNPLVPGELYLFDQPIYDVYVVAVNTAATRQTLFSIPQGSQFTPPGGAAITKTAYHTWLTQSGQLSAPQKHIVRGVSVAVRGNVTPNDLNNFLGQTLVQFFIDRMDFLTVILQQVGGAGGAFSGAAAGIVSNGLPVSSNFYPLAKTGETLEQQQNFRVIVDPTIFDDGLGAAGAFTTDAVGATPPGTGIMAWFALEGELARAVQ